jgi:solute carrier family 50 protein (sugar transporter)
MVDDKLVESIFGWIGLAISTYFYLSPVVPFIKVVKGEMKYQDSPGVLLLCNIMNCILWIDYGLMDDSFQVYLTCTIGGFLTLIWSTIYLIFLAKKILFLGLLYNILLLTTTFIITYVFYFICDKNITGIAAMVFNTLMLAAPGEKIYTVIKTGKYKLIPIFSTIGSLLCAGSWFMFGVYKADLNLIIPNGLGLIFGAFQLIVYCIFYRKSKEKIIPNDDDLVI